MIETTTKDELIALAGLGIVLGGALILGSANQTPVSGGMSHVSGMSAPYASLPANVSLHIGDILKIRPLVIYLGPPRSVFTYAKIVQNSTVVYGSGIAGVAIGFDNPTAARQYPLVPGDELQPDGTKAPDLWLYPWPGPPGPGGSPGGGGNPGGICGVPPRPGAAQLFLDVYFRATESGNTADADGFSSPTCNHRTLQAQSQSYPVTLL